jgi:hypothetical protein
MKDSVGRWYKNNFDRLKVMAPSSAWKSISDRLKEWPAGWYKANSDGLSSEPAPASWDAITAGVKPYNVGIRSARFMIYKISAAVLVFAILPFDFSDMSSLVAEEKDGSSGVNNIVLAKWNAYSPSSHQFTANGADDNGSSKNVNVIPLAAIVNSYTRIVSLPSSLMPIIKAGSVQSRRFNLDNLPLLAVTQIDTEPSFILASLTSPEQHLSLTLDKKWAVGVKVNAHGSTLITPETSLALNSESSLQSAMGYSLSYGISGMYRFNYKNSIEADLLLNDKKTQRIQNYSNGNSVERRTDITYSTLSVSYKRNLLNSYRPSRRKFALNTVSGLYLSRKTELQERLNGAEVNILGSGFGSMDFGLNLGLDYSVDLTPSIQWNTGVKLQVGLINVFNGIDKVPASFFRTYTNSFGLTTSLSYRF